MKSKAQKNTMARKNAEAVKAKKKAMRDAKSKGMMATAKTGAKSKSNIPQAKKKSK